MSQRKAVTNEMAKRYASGSKKVKGQVLDELCALTGWTRRHARRALTQPAVPRRPRKTPVTYDDHVLEPLRRIWAVLGGPCGKRLVPFMAEAIAALERHGELELDPAVRAKLLRISPATVDRMLAGERHRTRLKGRSGTKPGSMLKNQIPIRTFADWDDAQPGFCEIDLVGHDGGVVAGEYCQTLMLTDVASGWCEPKALRNKAQRWVQEALTEISGELPFTLLGLDSDNGSEFINHHILAFCEDRDITFTRSRPYRKNDNCFVEQKNWTVVRHAVGYARFDTPAELEVLRELYVPVALMVNFFRPQMKLVEKTRVGSKVTRRYDTAKTPYQRLLASDHISAEAKAGLTERYQSLNPAELARAIGRLQDRLVRINIKKPRKEVKPNPNTPWRTSPMRQRSGSTRTS
jgi:hypothetical protein